MLHLAGYFQSIDPASVFTNLPAIPDQALRTNVNDIIVPNDVPNIVGQAALINDASLVRAQFSSPSLRAMLNLDVEPIVQGKVFGSLPDAFIHGDSPIPLKPGENLNFGVLSDPAAAALHYGLVWLSDGAIKPVTGPMYTVRFTTAAVLAAGSWVLGVPTLLQSLPVGRYNVTGLRARGTNLLAARFVFPGQAWRPGVPAVNAIGNYDGLWSRYGAMGIMGQFDTTTLFQMECLGDTDNSQIFDMDLQYAGPLVK
jgi:hypothetical protein